MKTMRSVALALAMLTSISLLSGCGEPAKKVDPEKKPVPAAEHGAHGAGPHGGAITDWGGGKYHVEFTVDHNKQEAVIYVLGSDEKTPTPIKAKDGELLLTIKEPAFQVPLKAAPLTGEAAGTSSAFVGKHESLGKVQEFAGTISGEVDGTPFAGDFQETAEGPPQK